MGERRRWSVHVLAAPGYAAGGRGRRMQCTILCCTVRADSRAGSATNDGDLWPNSLKFYSRQSSVVSRQSSVASRPADPPPRSRKGKAPRK
jgi:hypothetical protein